MPRPAGAPSLVPIVAIVLLVAFPVMLIINPMGGNTGAVHNLGLALAAGAVVTVGICIKLKTEPKIAD